MKTDTELPSASSPIRLVRVVALCAVLLPMLLSTAFGQEREFYVIPLDRLPLAEGHPLSESRYEDAFSAAPMPAARAAAASAFPYIWVEGSHEVYVAPTEWPERWSRFGPGQILAAIAAPSGEPIEGVLFYPLRNRGEGYARLPFRLEPGQVEPAQPDDFHRVKEAHYNRLLAGGYVGGSWFRRQIQETRQERNQEREVRQPLQRQPGASELERTFAFFSGGRAISENLALDTTLEFRDIDGRSTRAVSDIRGITIQEYDWQRLLKEKPAKLDALAGLIPADQHGLFFHDADGVLAFVNEWQSNGLPLLSLLDPVSVPAGIVQRYETQLGLPLQRLAEFSAQGRIRSIAITGGDPFFATGTDLALLLETSDPGALLVEIEGILRSIAEQNSDTELSIVDDGSRELRLINPNRSRSCFVTTLGGAVAIANSPRQMEALRRVAAGEAKALVALDEYLVFRTRYSVSDDTETGFLILTDDTIRRWCGPEWRIGASRRLRAAAFLSDLNARHLPDLAAGQTPGEGTVTPAEAEWLGGISWSHAGARSERYNDLGFLTPISELDVENVSAEEARAYERWRTAYEAEWQEFFDPIAISFAVSKERIGVDVTVMPLIASTEYRRVRDLAGSLIVAAGSGDPRSDALAQIALAVDPHSEPMQMVAGMGQMFGGNFGMNPLAWMGGTVSLYLDDDLFWRALEGAGEREMFLMQNFGQIPVALHIDSKDPPRLAFFLSGMRTMIEQTAPGMLRWETRTHGDHPYVALVQAESARGMDAELSSFTIFYAARRDALVVSLNEDVIRRSFDRHEKRKSGEKSDAGEWLGNHLNLKFNQQGLRVLDAVFDNEHQEQLHVISQAFLPLLNDWKVRFPERDSLELVRSIWRIEPLCPAGGEYVWNDEYKTYESTEVGSPASPRFASKRPAILRQLERINLGATFENDGIRARGELFRREENSEPEASTASDQAADGIETGRYYPHPDGASWTWEEIDQETGEISRTTEKVVGREEADGRSRIVIEGTWIIAGEEMRYRSWRSDDDGFRLHRSDFEGMQETHEPPNLILPRRMVAGRPYPSQSIEITEEDGTTTRTRNEAVFVLEGFETIEVKAGRFEDCLKIRTQVVTIAEEGPAFHHRATIWFAPGVGPVKERWESGWQRGASELVSFRMPN
jgi:hypothetical protein